MPHKEFYKSLATNVELIEGVREVIVFSTQGIVYAHNIKAFAVKKAVLVFLFHHLTELLARASNQLTPIWFVGRSLSEKLVIGQLTDDVFVAVTGDGLLDEERLRAYLEQCAEAQKQA